MKLNFETSVPLSKVATGNTNACTCRIYSACDNDHTNIGSKEESVPLLKIETERTNACTGHIYSACDNNHTIFGSKGEWPDAVRQD